MTASPTPVRQGVITLSGYGISVRVDRGHLLVEDGVGRIRRRGRFPRVRHGIRRVVVIGEDGAVSLAALRWLADQNAAFLMMNRDGSVLAATGPAGPSDARLRRAQAQGPQSGAALAVARELIGQKLAAQERLARTRLRDAAAADMIARFRAAVPRTKAIPALLMLEANAAGAYWGAWRAVPVTFPRKDVARVPDHWRSFGSRMSPLSASPRHAINPANAMLNYLYTVLAAEARLAAVAAGLDPGLGTFHADTGSRDSLAYDLMEPVRPHVDAYVLDWLVAQPLRREWFFEQRNGNCRLIAEFAARLTETAAAWADALAPIAQGAAALFAGGADAAAGRATPTIAAAAPSPARICQNCGSAINPGTQLCCNCGIGYSRKRLLRVARAGRYAAQSAMAQARRSETQRRQEAGKRAWLASRQPEWPDAETYERRIQPRLAGIAYRALASALGVSEPYAAGIRAGRRVPHPRHWVVLAELTGVARPA